MTFQIIFLLSGLCILLLVFTKLRALESKKNSLLLNLISLGDVKMRDLTHEVAHLYTEGKERGTFLVQKQVPLHSKNMWNKSVQMAKERSEMLVKEIKESKMFKQEEGISEYLKTISDKEADAAFQEDFQNTEDEVK